jgi:hypothetical protein
MCVCVQKYTTFRAVSKFENIVLYFINTESKIIGLLVLYNVLICKNFAELFYKQCIIL